MRPLGAITAVCVSLALGFGQSNPGAEISLEKYRTALQIDPSSSLAHYRIAEIYFQQKDYQSAANEFRAALNGDLRPEWVEKLSHVSLGAIFNLSGQFDRADNEYRIAESLERPVSGHQATGTAPQLLQKTEPEYSDEARAAGLEGTVLITGMISEEGVARDMRVTGSLGLGLDEKALAAMEQWRFLPGTRDGHPVGVEMTVPVEFRLPDKQSRWHLIRAEFVLPEGATRPQFSKTLYPYGAGISIRAREEGAVIVAVGREATALVAFDIDENGSAVNFQVLNASHPIWGPEALAVVRDWQFIPGMKSGVPVTVPCTLELVWGHTNLSSQALDWARAQMPLKPPVPSH